MPASQRATVYFPPKLYRALKVRAALTDRGFSEIVTEAVRLLLKEDAIDENAVRERRKESTQPYSEVLRELKRDGLL
ncbi:MAG TPA: hypothetical protein VIY69_18665 [Candidatus Acidoferrales bacterium]